MNYYQQTSFNFGIGPDNYDSEDLVITRSNLHAYNLINSWWNWTNPVCAIIGAKGSGKSHFAHVWQQRSNAFIADTRDLKTASNEVLKGRAVVLEDLKPLNFDEKEMFHLFNTVKQFNATDPKITLLITAQTNITLWDMKIADLASRFRAVTTVEILAPDDTLLRAVLIKSFANRQIDVDSTVINYMLTRAERSLSFILDLVDLCDKKSLEKQSKITRAIAGEALNELQNSF